MRWSPWLLLVALGGCAPWQEIGGASIAVHSIESRAVEGVVEFDAETQAVRLMVSAVLDPAQLFDVSGDKTLSLPVLRWVVSGEERLLADRYPFPIIALREQDGRRSIGVAGGVEDDGFARPEPEEWLRAPGLGRWELLFVPLPSVREQKQARATLRELRVSVERRGGHGRAEVRLSALADAKRALSERGIQ
jgi:hypothetical protein